ncbi:MAG TPA: TlpA disulfide reductase family protein [Candidatus Babeliales bacterium]|nr:TlpA disulfide reductase family protein [Candidatus Babeliales bacterium]
MQPSSASSKRRQVRIWDAITLAAIAFALWKIFIAPTAFNAPGSLPAPHAVFARLDGGSFRLAAQRGRLVFLEFYASWCEPCKLQLPLVEAWGRSHPGVLIVPVDVGEARAVAAEFARRYSLQDVALDPSAGSRALFGLAGFPTVVVVDRSGDIRARWEGLNPAIGLAMSGALRRL